MTVVFFWKALNFFVVQWRQWRQCRRSMLHEKVVQSCATSAAWSAELGTKRCAFVRERTVDQRRLIEGDGGRPFFLRGTENDRICSFLKGTEDDRICSFLKGTDDR